jgi:signal transduction histidine kinase
MTWHRRNRPPWWPENEPWPPRHRRHHGPPRFIRRLGCLFASLVLFTAAVVSMVARGHRIALLIAVGAAVVVALTSVFAFTLRRVAHHFRSQNELRRQLMADVAHELRTPLAILQGRIEGLLDGVYPRDDAHLEELLEETRHLARLVEDLRTLADAEAGALELKKEPVDVGELIRDAAASFERPIEVGIPDELPLIDADPVRIREVLLNLLSNAVRHAAPDGMIAIRAEAASRKVVIRVIDNGSGIAPDDLPKIFDRFYKGAASRGSGLGLAIARKLVLAHSGTIDAASRAGEGTTITVVLPTN